jgi:hypothetical protein
MKRTIKTYSDLLQEEQRLQVVINNHKALIKADIAGIKDNLNPVKKVVNTFKQFTTRGKIDPLANIGLNFSIDVLVRKLLLARAGWISKTIVPFLVKNVTSHLINEQDRTKISANIQKLFHKIVSKIKHKKEPVIEPVKYHAAAAKL